MQPLLTASLAPHARASATTRRIMLDVLIALLPAAVMSVVYFGARAAYIICIAVAASMLGELLMNAIMHKPVTLTDGSAAVTGVLTAFCLPAGVPLWLPFVGGAFAAVVVKGCFGGLGRNFLNPALAARALLLASWPVFMTTFPQPGASDAVSAATPLNALYDAALAKTPLWDMFIGNISGCLGEVSTAALLLGALYLLLRRVITPVIPVVYIGVVALLTFVTGGDAPYALLSGGLMLGAFFMATDYVTSPATPAAQAVYAVGCGVITFLIRRYGAYPDGICYSILLMNIATPLIERYIRPRPYGKTRRGKPVESFKAGRRDDEEAKRHA